MAATNAKKEANRWAALLDAAAAQFAQRGYHATTIRDIAKATAMTPGAIYFHVPTKQHLLLAVYEEGVRRILENLEAALVGRSGRFERLEAAVIAHLKSINEPSPYARVIIRVMPDDIPEIADQLKRLRERYEAKFRAIMAALPVARGRNRDLARLFLLGAMNWMPVWYRGQGDDLAAIGRELLAPLRAALPAGDLRETA
jgi:AcrR family transcriptional regulator